MSKFNNDNDIVSISTECLDKGFDDILQIDSDPEQDRFYETTKLYIKYFGNDNYDSIKKYTMKLIPLKNLIYFVTIQIVL